MVCFHEHEASVSRIAKGNHTNKGRKAKDTGSAISAGVDAFHS
jgi:hypothetical protein